MGSGLPLKTREILNRAYPGGRPGQRLALLEGLIAAAGLILVSYAIDEQVAPSVVSKGLGLAGMTAATIAALHPGIKPHRWWLNLIIDCLAGGFLAIALVIEVVLLSKIDPAPDIFSAFGSDATNTTLLILLSGPIYVAWRIAFAVIRWWNEMRRRRFLWSLTGAHLNIVWAASAAVLIIGIATSLGENIQPQPGPLPQVLMPLAVRLLAQVFPWAFIGSMFMIMGIAVVLPVSLVFSYIVSRGLTRRIETLALATRQLRAGDLHTRVPVQGKDEIAQLQDDFNHMSEQLETATHEMQNQKDQIAGLLENQRQMAASVSHELRTPVATLRGYLETDLERWQGELPPGVQHDLEVMQHEVARLQAQIDDLFTLSRAELNRLDLVCRAVDVAALVDQIVATAAPLAWKNSRIEVNAQAEEDLPPAWVDAGRLEQCLRNLVQNGVRHTPPGGIVVIETLVEGDRLRVNVKDTGEGILPADLPHIWERFYRGNAANNNVKEPSQNGSTPQGAGDPTLPGRTGLGLALVKELVEAMGGSVSVESSPGQGSCFSLYLRRPTRDKIETFD